MLSPSSWPGAVPPTSIRSELWKTGFFTIAGAAPAKDAPSSPEGLARPLASGLLASCTPAGALLALSEAIDPVLSFPLAAGSCAHAREGTRMLKQVLRPGTHRRGLGEHGR